MAKVQDVYSKHFRAAQSPSGWEVWSWFFMRISGLLLVFLLLGHMAIMHVFGGGVDRINFDFVAARWDGFFWRTFDWMLLALALLHGGNGARIVIEDYIRKDGLRVFLKAGLYATVFIFFTIGTFVILTFDASQMPGGG